ncbi:MAG: universal stress protein [Chitinophagaceae bacterium]|nr:universal stress protein [Chitinophagaceae bacterium]
MKKIIAATDFSADALNAVNYAADMALSIDAKLVLLHVCQLPLSFGDVPVAVYLDELVKESEKDIEYLKEQLSKRMNGKLTIETLVKTGAFYEELEDACEEQLPYAVVTGSQGKTATQRMLFGSHAVYAMQHLKWPLITVPANATYSSIKNIGFACDFDGVIETTPVDEIKMLVNDFNASLHILNTGKEDEFKPEIVFQSGMLQEMLAALNPKYHFINNQNVEEGILQFAQQNNIDLLIVLPKKHSFIDKLIHKSHTKQLVLHSHVPVMALHEV